MEKVSFFGILFSFILWLAIYRTNNILYKKRKNVRNNSYLSYTLISILFCTFAYYVGDFPHYAIYYKECLSSSTTIHVEQVYFWLIKNMPKSYLLWRFWVWGTAVIIWVMIYKRMKFPAKYGCLIMTLILLYYFSAPRQSLAFAILFYSLTFIFYPKKNKYFSYILAFVGIYISLFFHKTTIIYVLFFVLAFVPFKRMAFIFSAVGFPFLYGAIMLYSVLFIGMFVEEESALVDRSIRYLGAESFGGFTAWGWVMFVVSRVPIFYSIVYCIWLIYFKQEQTPSIIKIMVKYAYICMYVGLLFFQQETSSFLSPRFLDATYYPLSIVLVYYLMQENKSKQMKTILNMFFLSNFYLFAYTLYKF